ncbi:GNAT family N-acetyltransferase [Oscillatoria sp. FACHB-1406]|uniref:GNAT family N-acetyltransferase n=1 Tax=Oscillatoria sp. FACHB-1406 TaxID=2692846 RepID=UPI001688C79D|nr:GNAT family N-acetyltransferase [Oscillatoria sp. FACHB-1406]MBD2576394.1 GNAT family N-acetyltransferase [Oscillatoria sp. FACHB-1406]
MTETTPHVEIRALQYRDLEPIEALAVQSCELDPAHDCTTLNQQLENVRRWYGVLKFLSLFPNSHRHFFCAYVAEQNQRPLGMVQVSPFNNSQSTWRIDRVLLEEIAENATLSPTEIGDRLLRHCFETIVEARTWILEVNIEHERTLGLYRQNGFQPLAQLTYWELAPEQWQTLAERQPNLPNLLPVNNADAKLLYQLDTVSMPPLLRQVFDRHVNDFKCSVLGKVRNHLDRWLGRGRNLQGYIFEPQRKAAIGYFDVRVCRDGMQPHQVQLTVHPAYTWLYPELISYIVNSVKDLPLQALQLTSADYQPEREEYFEQVGAERIEHTLLMSRSVWHKIRETKRLDARQLSEMLQGLQPRTPIPTRMSSLNSVLRAQKILDSGSRLKKESSPKPPQEPQT